MSLSHKEVEHQFAPLQLIRRDSNPFLNSVLIVLLNRVFVHHYSVVDRQMQSANDLSTATRLLRCCKAESVAASEQRSLHRVMTILVSANAFIMFYAFFHRLQFTAPQIFHSKMVISPFFTCHTALHISHNSHILTDFVSPGRSSQFDSILPRCTEGLSICQNLVRR